jgi:hypothetical protein
MPQRRPQIARPGDKPTPAQAAPAAVAVVSHRLPCRLYRLLC